MPRLCLHFGGKTVLKIVVIFFSFYLLSLFLYNLLNYKFLVTCLKSQVYEIPFIYTEFTLFSVQVYPC